MKLFVYGWLLGIANAVTNQSTAGVEALVQRRLPNFAGRFKFSLTSPINSTCANQTFDSYIVSSPGDQIEISSASLSGLNRGLYAYLTQIAQTDIFWTGSYLDVHGVPPFNQTLTSSAIVKWRYHFNTVTFSYTAAFWGWEDWELELDWLALRGVNLPLAWIGFERVLVDTYRAAGLDDAQISSFFSGPAFQAWNRFGNIQGAWNGTLPMSWVDQQMQLGIKIVNRMVELGMTPVLPAFAGFVPSAYSSVAPSADIVHAGQWGKFSESYTNDSFLEPTSPKFATLQQSFMSIQRTYFGNVTHIYTLDQFNEIPPPTGNLTYLSNVSYSTWKSLKNSDPDAIWLLQGWLFFSQSSFWTNDRIKAFLDGVPNNNDMLILDLFSESQPQWQRTQSYYGKSWIWCMLHDYGGNMDLYGNIQNITRNPIKALNGNTTMVGMGLTMESQEGNEVVYDMFLDQAWSKNPLDTADYVRQWVTRRYAFPGSLPPTVYQAWELLRTSVYSNNNTVTQQVTRSILEATPNVSNIILAGHSPHPTVILYEPSILIRAWRLLLNATITQPALIHIDPFHHDLTDLTRQILANSFEPAYNNLISAWNGTNTSSSTVEQLGKNLMAILTTLDQVLYTNPDFLLSKWIGGATTSSNSTNTTMNAFFEYNARNQITLWGPIGDLNDYASKQWAGLVETYYAPRWQMFIDVLMATTPASYNFTTFNNDLMTNFEQEWNAQRWTGPWSTQGSLLDIIWSNPLLIAM